MIRFFAAAVPLCLVLVGHTAASAQSPAGPIDADSAAWWDLTGQLSSDAMEGRDAGSGGYERAAILVAERLAAAGVQPLSDDGGWFQRVPLEEVQVTHASLATENGALAFLDDFSVTANTGLPATLSAPLVYRGYCGAGDLGEVAGMLVICHGTSRAGLPSSAERQAAVRAAGAAGMMTIADPGFTVEPPRWPSAYARLMRHARNLPERDGFVQMSLRAEALEKLVDGQDAAALIAAGAAGEPLPSVDLGTANLAFMLRTAQFSSPNVLGYLPGTDPALADQAILLGAHLDGYGYGHAVGGDSLYNGTLDDAAYVALILHLAELRQGEGYARPIVIAFWAGEEKGLLGSRWFIDHPTYPLARIAGNINLDQLRPIFPLDLLTVHARTDTTLGADATAVAAAMGIRVQDDPEPERNLLRRSDHIVFLERGIPAVNFVFGYEPGTPSEAIYRQWYRTGYHRPQDDVNQPIDWQAAADFNRFFYALVDRVANQPAAPAWLPGSTLRPDPAVTGE